LERSNVAQSEPLESREPQPAARAGDVPERIASGVAIVGSVRRFAYPNSVED
jgi:hypothetical protein